MFQHHHVWGGLFVLGHGLVVQAAPPHGVFGECGVAGGHTQHVLEMCQQRGGRLRVLGVAQVVRHAHAQRHCRDTGGVQALLQHADQAGDALVLRAAEAERADQPVVRAAAHDMSRPRMRDRFGGCAERHHHLAAERASDGDDRIGEGGVAQVWLDAGEQHHVVCATGESGDTKLVVGPQDLTHVGSVELDLRAFLREVEERVGVDRGNDRCNPVRCERVDGTGGHLGDVEQSTQRNHHDGPVQRLQHLECGCEHVLRHTVAPANSPTT